jgi:hypothetical protein
LSLGPFHTGGDLAGPFLQALEQFGHSGFQTSGNHLQGDDPSFALALLDVGYVSPVHVQVDCHVSLCPSFSPSQRLNALSQLNQKDMTAAGHVFMVGILLQPCVWHARHHRAPFISPGTYSFLQDVTR